ncbi:MAG: VTT domain-containing protein [Aeromicrobium sp.]
MTRALLGFLFALAESGLGLGAVVPGEVAISSLAASLDGIFPILLLGLAVALGAVTGDHVGLTIGRLGGGRLRDSRLIARIGVDRWDKAAGLVQRHGFWAVLASRMLPVVRTVMPVVAGAAAVKYRTFLAASVIGAIGWSAVWVGAGAGLAASGALDGPWIYVAAAVVAVALLVRWVVGRRRAGAKASATAISSATPAEIL